MLKMGQMGVLAVIEEKSLINWLYTHYENNPAHRASLKRMRPPLKECTTRNQLSANSRCTQENRRDNSKGRGKYKSAPACKTR